MSAYFTVFAANYIPIHVTRVDKADNVWTNNLGTPLLKVHSRELLEMSAAAVYRQLFPTQLPFGDSERLGRFPVLQPQVVTVVGAGWSSSAADVILSSAGWVAVTVGRDQVCSIRLGHEHQ